MCFLRAFCGTVSVLWLSSETNCVKGQIAHEKLAWVPRGDWQCLTNNTEGAAYTLSWFCAEFLVIEQHVLQLFYTGHLLGTAGAAVEAVEELTAWEGRIQVSFTGEIFGLQSNEDLQQVHCYVHRYETA